MFVSAFYFFHVGNAFTYAVTESVAFLVSLAKFTSTVSCNFYSENSIFTWNQLDQ